MAERRMFSKQITDSDAFMDMPHSTQNLYFHFGMQADDDGFLNNAKKIMRMLGATEDDMKILLAKNFIIPFDSGVCVIKHWKVHNYIPKDRYKPTIYHDEAKKITLKNNNVYTMNTACIQDVSSLDTQVRLGKVRLDNTIVGNDVPSVPHQKIIDLYKTNLPMLIQVREWTESRSSLLRSRWREKPERQNLDWWDKFFKYISESDFLTGKNDKWKQCDLEWILKSKNFVKILEGKYHGESQ